MTAVRAVRGMAPWGGRRHRHAAIRGPLAHVEVRGLDGDDGPAVADAVVRALLAEPGVVRATVIGPLGRAVVEVDDTVDLPAVTEAVAEVEHQAGVGHRRFPFDRPDHPADAGPVVREAVAVAVDVAAAGVALASRFAHLPHLPAEIAGVAALAQSYPTVRNAIATVTGPTIADVSLSLATAGLQAAVQGPAGALADLGHRVSLVGEARARRAAWERVQGELCEAGLGCGEVVAVPHLEPRSGVPLRPGPVETYTERAAVASLAAAAGTFAATADLRRSAAAAMATTPKAARLGRDAFAAHLGRVLADRDVLCLDPGSLRRLDRLDTVVLDASAVLTGELAVDHITVLADEPPAEARRRVRELFDPHDPMRAAEVDGWSLRPLTDGEGPQSADDGAPATHVLALQRGDETVATVTVTPAVEPMARTLAETVRAAGHMVVVAGPEDLALRLRADLHLPTGEGPEGLTSSVRMLQDDGCGVALLAASDGTGAALGIADLGVGLVATEVPWTADLLVQDLTSAALVLEALGIGHDVSRQSTALALAGSAVGGVLAVTSPPAQAASRAMGAVNGAAIAAVANGARAALAFSTRAHASPEDHPPWHELDADEVLGHLEATPEGLTAAEAAERLRLSATFEQGPISFPVAVLEELANPITPVLAGATALSTAVGSLADAGIIAAVVAANALVGGVQRYQVERAVRRLEVQSSQRVRVLRDGETEAVPVHELVPGDIVTLSAGDSVPADGRILESAALEVDESSLTGESMPVAKAPDAALSPVVAEQTSMVYEGTVVAAGDVTAVVVATGPDTEARRGDTTRAPGGGVEARLLGLTRVTLPIAGLAGAGIVGTGLLRGRSLARSLHTGVSLAVAAVPEGLPILATMAQLSAAKRLSARGALVRNPRAIEALGRVDLLCCDKTGTLTEGRIELQGVSDGVTDLDLTDRSGPGARILAAALRASPSWNANDDPLPHLTDRAVVDGAARYGVDASVGLRGWRRRAELPFEPARGYHAVVGRNGGSFTLSVKGAPEVVLPRCTHWQRGDEVVPLDEALRAQLEATVDALARRGARILAVAEREASGRTDLDDERVDQLRLLGFIALSDPVRPEAAASVATLTSSGVRIVMITGDHPSTAEGIAAELGLLNGHRILTGPQLDEMDDDALDAVLDDTTVFARVTPTHKVRLVSAYQRQGRTVAMTGDGSNDAPAIRLADVGIALGEHSTSAARAVADVVVADGRIETLIDAIVEGRAMWASVREAIAVLVGGNLGEILFTVGTNALATDALSPRQLLLVNLFTDVAPALAIVVRAPRNRRPVDLLREGPEASLGVPLERQIVSRAIATAAGAGLAWAGGRMTGRGRRASSIALVGLVGSQLGQTLVVGGRDPVVMAASLGSAAGLVAVIQTPGVSGFFGCTPLGPVAWAIGVSGAAAGIGLSLVLPPIVSLVPRFADPVVPPARPDTRTGATSEPSTSGLEERREEPSSVPSTGLAAAGSGSHGPDERGGADMAFEVTEVQRVLKGAQYPARGPDLAELAKSNGADDALVEALAGLEGELSGPDQVMHALKGSLTGRDEG